MSEAPRTAGSVPGRIAAAVLVGLVLLGVVLRVASVRWNEQLFGDVNLFALTARELVLHGRLDYPMKYDFSDGVPYLALRYAASQHPPLWPFVGGTLARAIGSDDTFAVLKALSLGCGVAMLALVAWHGLTARRRVETLAAVALIATSPLLVDFSGNGSPYIALALAIVAATVLLERADFGRARDYAVAGLLAAIALSLHQSMSFLPLAFAAAVLWERPRGAGRGTIAFAAAALVCLTPWLVWSLHYFGRPFHTSSGENLPTRLGLVEIGIVGDAITTHSVKHLDAHVVAAYLAAVRDTALQQGWLLARELGPFSLPLAAYGVAHLARVDRRRARSLLLPTLVYASSSLLWALSRNRFIVPVLPAVYLAAAAGCAALVAQRGMRWWLGCAAAIGALVWNVAGLIAAPSARYTAEAAQTTAGYRAMVGLAQRLGAMERGVVLGDSVTLVGGVETVYWTRFPFVRGDGLPVDLLPKAADDFDVRYIWIDNFTAPAVERRFPSARRVLTDGFFSVLELPSVTWFELPEPVPPQPGAGDVDGGRAALAARVGGAVDVFPEAVELGEAAQLLGARARSLGDGLQLRLLWAARSADVPALDVIARALDATDQVQATVRAPLPGQAGSGAGPRPARGATLQRLRLETPESPPPARVALAVVGRGAEERAFPARAGATASGSARSYSIAVTASSP